MYSRAMPMYGDGEKKGGDAPLYDGGKDANEVGRFDDFDDDEEIIRQ